MKIKTTLLKIVTLIIDAFVAFFAFTLTMDLISSIRDHSIFGLQISTIISLYLAVLVILGISFCFFKIFRLIDTHKFFTTTALKLVKTIRYLFITGTVVLMGILPFVYYTADQADAPGIIIIALGIIFIPLAIAAFISVMEKILINSIQFKQENELTI